MRFNHFLASALVALALPAVAHAKPDAPTAKERALHERLIVLDTHFDTPSNFARPGWNIMDRHSFETDMSDVDYPRMVDGGVDGGFWVVFTEQGPLTPEGFAKARDHALKRSLEIREMVARNSDHFELALTAADAERITKAGKRIVYQSMENSYPLGMDLTLMDTFYAFGVRMFGPIHFSNNQLGDSSTDKAGFKWGGLSPLGQQYVERANRLGALIDGSHASDASLEQMIALSKTPIILSHTGLSSINKHPRNIDDALLKKLAASGGVIQLHAVDFFLAPMDWRAYSDDADAFYVDLEKVPANQAGKRAAGLRALETRYQPHANFETVMRQLLHAIEVAGVDHVGLGADWDGGAGVEGYRGIDRIPMITARLSRAGYSEQDIGKIMGGNVIRLLRQAEEYARKQAAAPATETTAK